MAWFRKNKNTGKDTPGNRSARQLTERRFDPRDIPPQAQVDREATASRVWQNAVWLYVSNFRPDTGQPWNGSPMGQVTMNTCEQAAAACQADAIELSSPEDAVAAKLSTESGLLADDAIDEIGRAEQLLHNSAPNTVGGMSTAREVIQSHRADEELAAERERAGDTRHLQKPVEPAWISIAACVLALVDVLLLWKPVLGLGVLESGDMLLKWAVAVGGSAFVAWFIDRTVWKYRAAERDMVDRRAALVDHRRTMHNVRRDSHQPAPEITELTAADNRLVTAYGWLVLAATLTGIVSGVRIAVLARHSGIPVPQAALFGAVIGIMLGGSVVMLGYWSCRGNWLGDRLRLGAKIVSDIDAAHRRSISRIEIQRESARAAKSEAETLATKAVEIRNSVISQYREALLLCWGWAGFDRALMKHPGVVSREIPIAEHSASIRESVTHKLAKIDRWLARSSSVVAQVGATQLALPVGVSLAPVSKPLSIPKPYQRLPELRDEPTTPILWLVAGSITTVLAAVITAWLTGSPLPIR